MAKTTKIGVDKNLPINLKKIKVTLRKDIPTIKYAPVTKLQTNFYYTGLCFHPISRIIDTIK
jgi:hypothetical protein